MSVTRRDGEREGLPELLFIEMLERADCVRTREGVGEKEGRDAASSQAAEGSAGRLSLACLRAVLSDYLFQSHLRITTHLREQLHL